MMFEVLATGDEDLVGALITATADNVALIPRVPAFVYGGWNRLCLLTPRYGLLALLGKRLLYFRESWSGAHWTQFFDVALGDDCDLTWWPQSRWKPSLGFTLTLKDAATHGSSTYQVSFYPPKGADLKTFAGDADVNIGDILGAGNDLVGSTLTQVAGLAADAADLSGVKRTQHLARLHTKLFQEAVARAEAGETPPYTLTCVSH
jgi:hypothetical protein